MSKATFASRTFRGSTFASGAWRGVGASTPDPIDWIGFTARGSVPYASASGDASGITASGVVSYAATSGDVSEIAATGAQPVATITGRPYV
jgi:hypothetical protein